MRGLFAALACLLALSCARADDTQEREKRRSHIRDEYIRLTAQSRAVPALCPGLTMNPRMFAAMFGMAIDEDMIEDLDAIAPGVIDIHVEVRIKAGRERGIEQTCRTAEAYEVSNDPFGGPPFRAFVRTAR